MAGFEKVSRFADVDIPMPMRKTDKSAGYDMVVAEDTVVQPYEALNFAIRQELSSDIFGGNNGIITQDNNFDIFGSFFNKVMKEYTLDEVAELTKKNDARPTLVPTGMKCIMGDREYLSLHIRSSSPLKYWITLANNTGIIDADYYNNPDNEGEIFFQVINFSPVAIKLQKGDIIGQAILHNYETTFDDEHYSEYREVRSGGFGSTTK